MAAVAAKPVVEPSTAHSSSAEHVGDDCEASAHSHSVGSGVPLHARFSAAQLGRAAFLAADAGDAQAVSLLLHTARACGASAARAAGGSALGAWCGGIPGGAPFEGGAAAGAAACVAVCSWREPGGWSALHVAKTAPVAALLAEAAPHVLTARGSVDGATPLHLVRSARVLRHMCAADAARAAQALAARSIEDGWTPLHCAAANGAVGVVRGILRFATKAAEAAAASPLNGSPAAAAGGAGASDAEAARDAGDAGVHVALRRDRGGRTPLHVAVQFDDDPCVEALVRAAPTAASLRSVTGEAPLHDVFSARVARLLLSASTKETLVRNDDGCAPLHRAVDGDIAEALLEHSEGVETSFRDRLQRRTPLHAAAAAGRHDVVRVLLRVSTAEAAVRDADGCTPLLLAVKAGDHLSAAQLAAADPEQLSMRDSEGQPPLHVAAASGNRKVVEVLLHAGADASLVNDAGAKAVDLCLDSGDAEIAALLAGAEEASTTPP